MPLDTAMAMGLARRVSLTSIISTFTIFWIVIFLLRHTDNAHSPDPSSRIHHPHHAHDPPPVKSQSYRRFKFGLSHEKPPLLSRSRSDTPSRSSHSHSSSKRQQAESNTGDQLDSRQLTSLLNGLTSLLDPLVKDLQTTTPTVPGPRIPLGPLTTWNANQRIELTGAHRFVAPGPKDLRGPCPGLNALANHGYLPRNGVTGLAESVRVVNDIFGIGTDLGLLLALYAVIFLGDPVNLSWSIGGKAGTTLPLLFGEGRGLSGSHNIYESDSSTVAGDYSLFNGDVDTFQPHKLRALLNLQPPSPSANYNLPILIKHRAYTLNNSISLNPTFFHAPFAGIGVANAGHIFVSALMSNYTPLYPGGLLNKGMLLDWYAMDEDSAVKGTGLRSRGRGWSTFPKDWYRRPRDADYDTLAFATDLLVLAGQVPGALKVGGNTGKVNSFAGVDLGNLTGGIFNTADLLQNPQAIVCFLYQLLSAVIPGALRTRGGLVGNLLGGSLSALFRNAIPVVPLDPKCPRLDVWDESALRRFPGYGGGFAF